MAKRGRKTLCHIETNSTLFLLLKLLRVYSVTGYIQDAKLQCHEYVRVRQAKHSSLHSAEFHDHMILQFYLNATISYSAGAWF